MDIALPTQSLSESGRRLSQLSCIIQTSPDSIFDNATQLYPTLSVSLTACKSIACQYDRCSIAWLGLRQIPVPMAADSVLGLSFTMAVDLVRPWLYRGRWTPNVGISGIDVDDR